MDVTPKHYTFKVGSMDCTVLLDGATVMDAERIIRVFPDATEAEYRQAYADMGLSIDDGDLSFNILCVKLGEQTVLVDTGEAGRPSRGLLPESLKLANIDLASVTLVVITHCHVDHILGLVTEGDKPAFPNATYVISKPEMTLWQERMDAGHVEYRPLVEMMQRRGLRLIDMGVGADEQIIPGVTAVPLPGHTPGHIGLLFESDGEGLLHLADALHTPMQIPHPEWSATADMDTSTSVPTRRDALKRAADNTLLTLFYHLTFPGLGYVRHGAQGFAWEPLP